MHLLVSVAVLALQRVPLVNRLPVIRDAGTIEGALRALTKAFNGLSNVAANQRAAEADIDEAIKSLEDERAAVRETAAKAERVAGKLAKLFD